MGLHARERERTPARVSSGGAHRGSPGWSWLDAVVGISGRDEGDAVCFRTRAHRGCRDTGGDGLVGNLRSKVPAMSLAMDRSGQGREVRGECRFRGEVNKQRREGEEVLCSDNNFTLLLGLR
jgi:hypothetical protein